MIRKQVGWAVAVVVALALAAVALVLVLSSDDDVLPAGFVAEGSSGATMTHEVAVHLPMGVLTVAVGDPLEEIAAGRIGRRADADDSEMFAAEDGASIVGLRWSFRPSLSYNESLAYPTMIGLAVTAGGTRHVLGAANADLHDSARSSLLPEASLIAVVAGDGRDLQVEVTYAGETQIADVRTGEVDAGRAEALYAADGPRTFSTREDCDTRTTRDARNIDAGYSSIVCTIGPLTQTPYLPDLGWASEGRVWSVLKVRTFAPDTVGWLPTGATYAVQRAPIIVTLDGDKPARASGSGRSEIAQGGTYVFDTAPAGASLTLDVTAPMTALRPTGSTSGPASVAFGVDQTFTLND